MQAKSSTGRQRGKGPRRFLTPEMYTHWDRGLAIVAGMIGVVLLFFLLLIALPINRSESSEPITGTGTAGTAGAASQSTTAPAQQATNRPAAAPATGPDQPRLSATSRQFPYVRRGPGTNFAVVMNLQQGQQVDVIARSVDRQWFQIVLPNNGRERGWVSQEFLTVEGDVNTLPEVRE